VSLARKQDEASIPAVVGEEVEPGWVSLERWALDQSAEEVAARLQLLEVPAAVIPLEQRPVTPAVESMPLRRPRLRPRSSPPLVVDLSSLWAGPLCARILGLAGCRVVKVESTGRPDGARRGELAFFDRLHAGHESVAVDFATPAGRRSLVALLQAADVVIEASRRRALRAMSILPDQIAGPGALWVSITAYGRDPATEQLVGFGDDVAGGAGGWVLDPRTGVPMPSLDAVADPLTGLAAAAAVLEVLHGEDSMVVDVAMHRVVTEAVGGRPTMPGTVWSGESSVPPKPDVRGRAPALGAHTAAVLAEIAARP
jgi:crotonobetainyl-CoA:carnitine CoA-transferase CaiB-like acyl-CoA transferase